jgi:hypothetical protein
VRLEVRDTTVADDHRDRARDTAFIDVTLHRVVNPREPFCREAQLLGLAGNNRPGLQRHDEERARGGNRDEQRTDQAVSHQRFSRTPCDILRAGVAS